MLLEMNGKVFLNMFSGTGIASSKVLLNFAKTYNKYKINNELKLL
ncbi:hypothetical protein [Oceanivirga salmonicida]|nr:hypothetical protein [Oceanivirga salmonicida]